MNGLMAEILEIAFALFLFSIGYIYLLNRLAKAVEPTRMRLAAEAHRLLNDPSLTDQERAQVRMYTKNAFSVWPVILSVLMLPAFAIALLLPAGRRAIERHEHSKLKSLAGMYIWSIVAASPLFGLILMVEYVVLLVVLILTLSQIKLATAMMAALAETENDISNRMLRAH